MSSYIESAYSIEHRRLQQIVTKCQQELNDSTSRLCKRRHEIENASDVFQEHMLRGQMEQKNQKRNVWNMRELKRENTCSTKWTSVRKYRIGDCFFGKKCERQSGTLSEQTRRVQREKGRLSLCREERTGRAGRAANF